MGQIDVKTLFAKLSDTLLAMNADVPADEQPLHLIESGKMRTLPSDVYVRSGFSVSEKVQFIYLGDPKSYWLFRKLTDEMVKSAPGTTATMRYANGNENAFMHPCVMRLFAAPKNTTGEPDTITVDVWETKGIKLQQKVEGYEDLGTPYFSVDRDYSYGTRITIRDNGAVLYAKLTGTRTIGDGRYLLKSDLELLPPQIAAIIEGLLPEPKEDVPLNKSGKPSRRGKVTRA